MYEIKKTLNFPTTKIKSNLKIFPKNVTTIWNHWIEGEIFL